MSLHQSLKSKNKLRRQRNVYTRGERLARLEKEGIRTTESSVYGLPKVKIEIGLKKKAKAKKAKEEEGAEGAAEKK